MGGGGGGGGSSIVLEAGSFSGALTVNANGGNGSNTLQGDNNCHGPGGGGGRVTFSLGAVPGGVTVSAAAGASGKAYMDDGVTERTGCVGSLSSSHGNTTGNTGTTGTSYTINTMVCSPTPVVLLNFSAQLTDDKLADLNWRTAMELNFSHFL
jgi:hypothetical protein